MIIYLYVQPASGKTTLAQRLKQELGPEKFVVIDGDELRAITKNFDYSVKGRIENICAAHTIARFQKNKQGRGVIIAMVSPFEALRRELQNSERDCFLFLLESERTRGDEFVCYDFEAGTPNMRINTDLDVEGCVEGIIDALGSM